MASHGKAESRTQGHLPSWVESVAFVCSVTHPAAYEPPERLGTRLLSSPRPRGHVLLPPSESGIHSDDHSPGMEVIPPVSLDGDGVNQAPLLSCESGAGRQ